MPRYVILHHELPAGAALTGGRTSHWDLMLEHDGVLRTWAIPVEPSSPLSCDAERLVDHRIQYLDYEGPITGNRGHVTRWDAGEYQVLTETEQQIEVELDGLRLSCHLAMRQKNSAHFWSVSFGTAPMRG